MFSKSVKSGVHVHAAVQQRSAPPAPQKSAADPFKAEPLRHPSNYPSHLLRPRARCFSRRLSLPSRWMSLMNLPLIRHRRDRANCFLHRRSFPQEAEQSVCGAAVVGSSTSEGGTEDVAARPARSDTEEKTERPWLQLQSSRQSFYCLSSRGPNHTVAVH